MVKDLNKIIDNKDFNNEDECRNLVFICANNHQFDLPFIYVLKYPVFDAYAEYWDKGRKIVERNTDLLNELSRPHEQYDMLSFSKEKLSRADKLSLQKKAIRGFLKEH